MASMHRMIDDCAEACLPAPGGGPAPLEGLCPLLAEADGEEEDTSGDRPGGFMEYAADDPEQVSPLALELEMPTEVPSPRRIPAHPKREVFSKLGCALAIHAALLLAAHLFSLAAPSPAAEPRFLVVSLAGFGGNGGGGAGTKIEGPPPGGAAAARDVDSGASHPPETGHESTAAAVEPPPAQIPEEPPQPAAESVAPPPRAVPEQAIAQNDPKPRKKPPARPDPWKPAGIGSAYPAKKASSPRIPAEVPEQAPAATGKDLPPGGGNAAGEGHGGDAHGGAGGSGQGHGGGKEGSGSGPAGTSSEFTLREVEHPPVVLRKVEPRFPEAARKLGITGKVVVKFLVKTDGRVARPSILEAQPPGLFEQSVLDTLDKWCFKPGAHKGRVVATWVVQPIQFRLAR
ncbi:MAG: TonB family protein [Desulfobacteraceae bacterium]|nr:TonB family protein [Desulfobacteraceae bacterium]